jgi:hypothetical protein
MRNGSEAGLRGVTGDGDGEGLESESEGESEKSKGARRRCSVVHGGCGKGGYGLCLSECEVIS